MIADTSNDATCFLHVARTSVQIALDDSSATIFVRNSSGVILQSLHLGDLVHVHCILSGLLDEHCVSGYQSAILYLVSAGVVAYPAQS